MFYELRYHPARIKHKCERCGKLIAPGENYALERTKLYQEFAQYPLCFACAKMSETYHEERKGNEFMYMDIDDYLYEKHCIRCKDENVVCSLKPQNCGKVRGVYENIGSEGENVETICP